MINCQAYRTLKSNAPFDVKICNNGKGNIQLIFISDFNQAKLQVFAVSKRSEGDFKKEITLPIAFNSRFLSVGKRDNLLYIIISMSDHTVRKYSILIKGDDFQNEEEQLQKIELEMALLWTSGSVKGNSLDRFDTPNGVVCDESRVYVCDFKNHRIMVLDLENGKVLNSFGKCGSKKGDLSFPYDITLDVNGNLAICDRNNHRIQILSKEGKFIKEIGCFGSGNGKFNFPEGICIDKSSGNIIVSDCFNQRVQIFNSKGEFMSLLGEGKPGSSMNHFSDPHGLDFCNETGKLYIADFGNKRVQIFNITM